MAINIPTVKPVDFSETLTFFEGDWHAGNVPIMGPRTHGAWLASTVFDGARAFEGVAPDLDRHCERVNRICEVPESPAQDEGPSVFGPGAHVHARPWQNPSDEGLGQYLQRACEHDQPRRRPLVHQPARQQVASGR